MFGPFQQVAFIVVSRWCSREVAASHYGEERAACGISDGAGGLRDPRRDGCRRLRRIGSRDDAVVGVNDLAQLDELFAAPQIAADLRAQRLGKEPGDLPAQLA